MFALPFDGAFTIETQLFFLRTISLGSALRYALLATCLKRHTDSGTINTAEFRLSKVAGCAPAR